MEHYNQDRQFVCVLQAKQFQQKKFFGVPNIIPQNMTQMPTEMPT